MARPSRSRRAMDDKPPLPEDKQPERRQLLGRGRTEGDGSAAADGLRSQPGRLGPPAVGSLRLLRPGRLPKPAPASGCNTRRPPRHRCVAQSRQMCGCAGRSLERKVGVLLAAVTGQCLLSCASRRAADCRTQRQQQQRQALQPRPPCPQHRTHSRARSAVRWPAGSVRAASVARRWVALRRRSRRCGTARASPFGVRRLTMHAARSSAAPSLTSL